MLQTHRLDHRKRAFGEHHWCAGSFFFLFAVTGMAGGFLSNRLSTRWLLLVMALLWAVVQLPIAFGSSLGMLIACRVLLGAGEGPAQPIAIHACYKWFPDERRNLPVSVFQQGAVLGMVVAGIAVPWIDAKRGWRTNFIVLAVLGLAWAILWLVAGREGPLGARATKLADESGVAASGPRISYRALLGTCLKEQH
ncbi:MFS transporter [Paraburkholderia sacchari]|uniref:MFS transporter n=1 Tax=Paraburkholderia sacchari TaxID=159450 RepID=UPI001FC7FF6B|nr:MFS transporter [Paraburkholderia sacchari]